MNELQLTRVWREVKNKKNFVGRISIKFNLISFSHTCKKDFMTNYKLPCLIYAVWWWIWCFIFPMTKRPVINSKKIDIEWLMNQQFFRLECLVNLKFTYEVRQQIQDLDTFEKDIFQYYLLDNVQIMSLILFNQVIKNIIYT